MKKLETRHPCPVCLGVKMEKISLTTTPPADTAPTSAPQSGDLVLDHCARCGGVWFEMGEVQLLRRTDPAALWEKIVRREGVHTMQCHSCTAHVPRSAASCEACGWKVVLECPTCSRDMDVSEQAGMRLDYCTRCKGVWFDHDELAAVWNMEVNALAERRQGDATLGSVVLLDSLMYDPFMMYYGIHAAGYVAGAAAEALAHAPDMLGSAPEVLGEVAGAATEVAGSLFETIVEIISSLFE